MTSVIPQIKVVVFDMDGLMFNTEDVFEIAGAELVRRRGFEMSTELRNKMMGRKAEESIGALIQFLNLKESIPALIKEVEQIFFSHLDEHLAPMPGLFELLGTY